MTNGSHNVALQQGKIYTNTDFGVGASRDDVVGFDQFLNFSKIFEVIKGRLNIMRLLNKVVLLLSDVVAFYVILMLAFGFNEILFSEIPFSETITDEVGAFTVSATFLRNQVEVYVVLALIGIVNFYQKGHYRKRAPWWQQAGHIISYCVYSFVVMGFINYILKSPVNEWWLIFVWILAIPVLMFYRLIAKQILKLCDAWTIDAVLVGGIENIIETLFALKSEHYLDYDVNYVVLPQTTKEELGHLKALHPNVTVHEELDEIHKDDMIILCPDHRQDLRLKPLIDRVVEANARYAVVPALDGFSSFGMQPSYFFGYNVFLMRPYSRVNTFGGWLLKKIMDVSITTCVLLLLAPFLPFIVKKIKKDGGPALYSQLRVGKGGRLFRCWKFRSMVVNADEVLEELLENDPEAREEYEKDCKLRDDPRITKVGAFIRKTSLDEVPQLWNVLKGDMSLVGPRPIIPDELEKYGERFDDYKAVKPGVTGLWQVSGRNDIPYELRSYLNSWYVKHWSLWTDIVILIKTFFVVVARRGAY